MRELLNCCLLLFESSDSEDSGCVGGKTKTETEMKTKLGWAGWLVVEVEWTGIGGSSL